jgi:hypothetical protein
LTKQKFFHIIYKKEIKEVKEMAKIPFTKLDIKINNEIEVIDFNETIKIEVKKYLPV